MKSYRKKNLLIIFLIFTFILVIIFFYLLNTIKLWTFNNYPIVNVSDNTIRTVISKKDKKYFSTINFFYYDTFKYLYKIEEEESYEDGVILTLSLNKNLELKKDDLSLLLPNRKKTIFSLIIESWRSK